MSEKRMFGGRAPEQILADNSAGPHTLHRALGPFSLLALGVGAVIGAGLFSLTGIAAGEYAGPAVILSFIVAAIGCALAGLCYAELSSTVPVGGSAYSYAYASMGQFAAFLIGWDIVIEHTFGAAAIAVSWSRYVNDLLMSIGVQLPQRFMHGPWDKPFQAPDGSLVHGVLNVPAMIIIVLVSLLLMVGVTRSSRVNMVMVVIKVAIIAAFIAVGVAYINPANYTPFIPPNAGHFGEFGWSGVLRGAAVLFFAYIGFDVISGAAQEVKNPAKNMPIGILGSLAICTVIYVAFAVVLVGMVNFRAMHGDAAPVATAINMTPYRVLGILVKLGIIAGFTTVMLVSLLGQSRILRAMSVDGLIPQFLGAIHPTWRTPWRANLLFMGVVAPAAGLIPISHLAQMTSIGTLLAFIVVCVAVMVLRKTRPDLPRAFRVPFMPWVPIGGIVVCLSMMLALTGITWVRLAVWMSVGVVVYFLYARPRSLKAVTATVLTPSSASDTASQDTITGGKP